MCSSSKLESRKGQGAKAPCTYNIISQLLHKVNMKKQIGIILKVLEIMGLVFFLWFAVELVVREVLS